MVKNNGVITAKQSEKIARAIGKELKPVWRNQVFQQLDESAQYLVTMAISRALVQLQNNTLPAELE